MFGAVVVFVVESVSWRVSSKGLSLGGSGSVEVVVMICHSAHRSRQTAALGAKRRLSIGRQIAQIGERMPQRPLRRGGGN